VSWKRIDAKGTHIVMKNKLCMTKPEYQTSIICWFLILSDVITL